MKDLEDINQEISEFLMNNTGYIGPSGLIFQLVQKIHEGLKLLDDIFSLGQYTSEKRLSLMDVAEEVAKLACALKGAIESMSLSEADKEAFVRLLADIGLATLDESTEKT